MEKHDVLKLGPPAGAGTRGLPFPGFFLTTSPNCVIPTYDRSPIFLNMTVTCQENLTQLFERRASSLTLCRICAAS